MERPPERLGRSIVTIWKSAGALTAKSPGASGSLQAARKTGPVIRIRAAIGARMVMEALLPEAGRGIKGFGASIAG